MDFSKVTSYLDSLESTYDIPGCDLQISYRGQLAYRHQSGWCDYARTKPITDQNFYYCYSVTKPLTVACFLHYLEQGKVHLEDEVSQYLPEFADMTVKDDGQNRGGDADHYLPEFQIGEQQAVKVRPMKGKLTVHHLLTMTSGLNYNKDMLPLKKLEEETKARFTTAQYIRALAECPLDFDPGTHYQYSMSHDVLGRILEVITGKTFGEVMQETVFDPLGMTSATFHITPEITEHLAAHYMYDSEHGKSEKFLNCREFIPSEQFESGGGGLIMKAEDYLKFAACMAAGGTAKNGYPLLQRETVERMITPELDAVCRNDFHMTKFGYNYGLGVRTLVDKNRAGARSPIGEFGWEGAAGAYVLMDITNDVAIFYAQHVRKCYVAFDVIHPTVRDLTYDALGL